MVGGYEKKQINTQAKRDLVEKLRLERIFMPEVRSLFSRMREDFKVQVAATGSAPPASNYSASWQGALDKHYKRVQKAFSGTVKEFNEKSLIGFEIKQEELTQEEEDQLEELLLLALLLYRNERTVEQEAFITKTNDKQMQEAIAQARQTLEEQELPTDNRSIAATAAVILARKFKGRTEGIITLETQAPAEATKLFEARTVAGIAPSVEVAPLDQVLRPIEAELFKTWRTIGDKRVRGAHRAANFQKVPIDDSFIVGGQMLLYPGDTSMGATISNVAGCRCSAVYSQ